MTTNTKMNVISASLGTAFVDGIRAFIPTPERSAFDSPCYMIFPAL